MIAVRGSPPLQAPRYATGDFTGFKIIKAIFESSFDKIVYGLT